MSADNVTPFRAGPKAGSPKHESSTRKGRRRARYQRVDALVLEEFPAEDGMRVYDVLAGLRAVCQALDELDSTAGEDQAQRARLAMAARALSSLLHNREADSCGLYRVMKQVHDPKTDRKLPS